MQYLLKKEIKKSKQMKSLGNNLKKDIIRKLRV